MIMSKIVHLVQRVIKEIKYLPNNMLDFGFKVSIYIARDHIFLRPKSKEYIRVIYDWTEKFMEPVFDKYKNDNIPLMVTPIKKIDKIPIWVCWFQGESAMPELVQLCYRQLKRNIPKNIAEVKLITLDNVFEYISLSSNVLQKFKDGVISYAFFSDIIRYQLLRDYGGMWIDSTIYVSSKIPTEWLLSPYYTMRMPKEKCPYEACEGNWTNFCFSGEKNNLVFCYVCDALEFFSERKSRIPDYVFLDYILMVGYRNIPKMKEIIDKVPYNNEEIWALKSKLYDAFDIDKYFEITNLNIFHKLAHQVIYPKKTDSGLTTFYGHIYEEDICSEQG